MDPALPDDWRHLAANVGRAGALGDVASHVINLAHHLCGPVAVHGERPSGSGTARVENDDYA
jgi:predicted dehydrogenase